MELIEKICSRSSQLKIEDFQRVDDELSKVVIEDFIYHAFKETGGHLASELMFGSLAYWRNLGLDSWKNILIRLQDSDVGVRHLLVFLGKYLGVDLRNEIESIRNKRTKWYIIADEVTDYATLFYFDPKFDNTTLQRFNLELQSFFPIKKRLISEGANEAKAKEPKRFRI